MKVQEFVLQIDLILKRARIGNDSQVNCGYWAEQTLRIIKALLAGEKPIERPVSAESSESVTVSNVQRDIVKIEGNYTLQVTQSRPVSSIEGVHSLLPYREQPQINLESKEKEKIIVDLEANELHRTSVNSPGDLNKALMDLARSRGDGKLVYGDVTLVRYDTNSAHVVIFFATADDVGYFDPQPLIQKGTTVFFNLEDVHPFYKDSSDEFKPCFQSTCFYLEYGYANAKLIEKISDLNRLYFLLMLNIPDNVISLETPSNTEELEDSNEFEENESRIPTPSELKARWKLNESYIEFYTRKINASQEKVYIQEQSIKRLQRNLKLLTKRLLRNLFQYDPTQNQEMDLELHNWFLTHTTEPQKPVPELTVKELLLRVRKQKSLIIDLKDKLKNIEKTLKNQEPIINFLTDRTNVLKNQLQNSTQQPPAPTSNLQLSPQPNIEYNSPSMYFNFSLFNDNDSKSEDNNLQLSPQSNPNTEYYSPSAYFNLNFFNDNDSKSEGSVNLTGQRFAPSAP